MIYFHTVQSATIYLHCVALIDPFQKKIAERAAKLLRVDNDYSARGR